MGGGMTTAMVFVTVVVMSLINGISAQKLIVGDVSGWTSPSSADFYETWAAKQNLTVGDTLVFEFTAGHTVATVTSKEAYEKCDATLDENPVIVSEGPYEITLTSAGQYYYLCTVGSHCANGQKFAATVSASPAGGSNPSPDLPPSSSSSDSSSPSAAPKPSTPAPPNSSSPPASPNLPSPPTSPIKDSAGGLTTSVIFVTFIITLVSALLYASS